MSHFAEDVLAKLSDVLAMLERKYEFLGSKCLQEKSIAISAHASENQREALMAMKRLKNYSKQSERMVKVKQALQKMCSALNTADTRERFVAILCHAVAHGETAVSETWLDRQDETTAAAFAVDRAGIEGMGVEKVVDLILQRLTLIDEEPQPDLVFTFDHLHEDKLREELEQLVQDSSSLPTGESDTAAPKPPGNQDEDDLQELAAWASGE